HRHGELLRLGRIARLRAIAVAARRRRRVVEDLDLDVHRDLAREDHEILPSVADEAGTLEVPLEALDDRMRGFLHAAPAAPPARDGCHGLEHLARAGELRLETLRGSGFLRVPLARITRHYVTAPPPRRLSARNILTATPCGRLPIERSPRRGTAAQTHVLHGVAGHPWQDAA